MIPTVTSPASTLAKPLITSLADENNAYVIKANPFFRNIDGRLIQRIADESNPAKIQEYGHYLYMHWDVESSIAVPSNQGLTHKQHPLGTSGQDAADFVEMIGFCLVSEGGANPEYEDFSSRYRTARTPWVVSQFYGSSDSSDRSDVSDANTYKLFRLHALDDGEVSNDQFRLLVSNLRLSGALVKGGMNGMVLYPKGELCTLFLCSNKFNRSSVELMLPEVALS